MTNIKRKLEYGTELAKGIKFKDILKFTSDINLEESVT